MPNTRYVNQYLQSINNSDSLVDSTLRRINEELERQRAEAERRLKAQSVADKYSYAPSSPALEQRQTTTSYTPPAPKSSTPSVLSSQQNQNNYAPVSPALEQRQLEQQKQAAQEKRDAQQKLRTTEYEAIKPVNVLPESKYNLSVKPLSLQTPDKGSETRWQDPMGIIPQTSRVEAAKEKDPFYTTKLIVSSALSMGSSIAELGGQALDSLLRQMAAVPEYETKQVDQTGKTELVEKEKEYVTPDWLESYIDYYNKPEEIYGVVKDTYAQEEKMIKDAYEKGQFSGVAMETALGLKELTMLALEMYLTGGASAAARGTGRAALSFGDDIARVAAKTGAKGASTYIDDLVRAGTKHIDKADDLARMGSGMIKPGTVPLQAVPESGVGGYFKRLYNHVIKNADDVTFHIDSPVMGKKLYYKDGMLSMSPAQYESIMNGLKRSSIHSMLSTPGDVEDRLESTAWRIAYSITPQITEILTPAFGSSIANYIIPRLVDTGLNTYLTWGQTYGPALTEGGKYGVADKEMWQNLSSSDFWRKAIPQLALDFYMARTTGGNLNRQSLANMQKYAQDPRFGGDLQAASRYLSKMKQDMNDIARASDLNARKLVYDQRGEWGKDKIERSYLKDTPDGAKSENGRFTVTRNPDGTFKIREWTKTFIDGVDTLDRAKAIVNEHVDRELATKEADHIEHSKLLGRLGEDKVDLKDHTQLKGRGVSSWTIKVAQQKADALRKEGYFDIKVVNSDGGWQVWYREDTRDVKKGKDFAKNPEKYFKQVDQENEKKAQELDTDINKVDKDASNNIRKARKLLEEVAVKNGKSITVADAKKVKQAKDLMAEANKRDSNTVSFKELARQVTDQITKQAEQTKTEIADGEEPAKVVETRPSVKPLNKTEQKKLESFHSKMNKIVDEVREFNKEIDQLKEKRLTLKRKDAIAKVDRRIKTLERMVETRKQKIDKDPQTFWDKIPQNRREAYDQAYAQMTKGTESATETKTVTEEPAVKETDPEAVTLFKEFAEKRANYKSAENLLKKLAGLKIDVKEANKLLREYQDIKRSKYGQSQEQREAYRTDKEEAWNKLVDKISETVNGTAGTAQVVDEPVVAGTNRGQKPEVVETKPVVEEKTQEEPKKDLWQKTPMEIAREYKTPVASVRTWHKGMVQDAVRDGKEVPDHVKEIYGIDVKPDVKLDSDIAVKKNSIDERKYNKVLKEATSDKVVSLYRELEKLKDTPSIKEQYKNFDKILETTRTELEKRYPEIKAEAFNNTLRTLDDNQLKVMISEFEKISADSDRALIFRNYDLLTKLAKDEYRKRTVNFPQLNDTENNLIVSYLEDFNNRVTKKTNEGIFTEWRESKDKPEAIIEALNNPAKYIIPESELQATMAKISGKTGESDIKKLRFMARGELAEQYEQSAFAQIILPDGWEAALRKMRGTEIFEGRFDKAVLREMSYDELDAGIRAALTYARELERANEFEARNKVHSIIDNAMKNYGGKVTKAEIDSYMERHNLPDSERENVEKQLRRSNFKPIGTIKKVMERGKDKTKWFMYENMTPARLAMDLEGQTWDIQKILNGNEVPAALELTERAATRAFNEKFALERDIFTPMQEFMANYKDAVKDSLAFRKAKDVRFHIFKDLEGSRISGPEIKEMELSVGEMMDVYMMMRGFIERGEDGTYKMKTDIKDTGPLDEIMRGITFEHHNTEWSKNERHSEDMVYKLTENDLLNVVNHFTANHTKAVDVADWMFDRYNSELKEYVNKHSLNSLGYRVATIDNYVPCTRSKYAFTIDPVNMWKSMTDSNSGLPKLTHADFGLKLYDSMGLLQQRAGNKEPIKIDDAYRKFTRYVTAASDLPFIEVYHNYQRVFGDSTLRKKLDSLGLGQHLDHMNKHMSMIATYQAKAIADVDRFTGNVLSKFQGAKLMMSPWIPPIQGISLMYAYGEIPTKYMPQELFKVKPKNATYDEMKEWAPVNGYGRLAMAQMSRATGEYLEGSRISQKVLNQSPLFQPRAIRMVDAWVVGRTWESLKKYVADEKPDLGHEEQMKLVSDMYDWVVNTTQPTYLPHTRGHITLRRDIFTRSLTMFFSQRNKIFNEVTHMVPDYMRSDKTAADFGKLLKKGAFYVVLGNILLSERDEWRDWFKMRANDAAANTVDLYNPLNVNTKKLDRSLMNLAGTVPVFGELIGVLRAQRQYGQFTSQDISNPIYEALDNGISALNMTYDLIDQYINEESYASDEGTKKWEKTAAKLGLTVADLIDVFIGIPAANTTRLAMDIAKRQGPDMQFFIQNLTRAPNSSNEMGMYWEHLKAGDKNNALRQMYFLIHPDFHGKDLKSFDSSYRKSDKLTEEQWEQTKELYTLLARDIGLPSDPDAIHDMLKPGISSQTSADMMKAFTEKETDWRRIVGENIRNAEKNGIDVSNFRSTYYDILEESLRNNDGKMIEDSVWMLEKLGADFDHILDSMQKREVYNERYGFTENYATNMEKIIDDAVVSKNPNWVKQWATDFNKWKEQNPDQSATVLRSGLDLYDKLWGNWHDETASVQVLKVLILTERLGDKWDERQNLNTLYNPNRPSAAGGIWASKTKTEGLEHITQDEINRRWFKAIAELERTGIK